MSPEESSNKGATNHRGTNPSSTSMPGAPPLYTPRLPASRVCWRKHTSSAGAVISALLRSSHQSEDGQVLNSLIDQSFPSVASLRCHQYYQMCEIGMNCSFPLPTGRPDVRFTNDSPISSLIYLDLMCDNAINCTSAHPSGNTERELLLKSAVSKTIALASVDLHAALEALGSSLDPSIILDTSSRAPQVTLDQRLAYLWLVRKH